MLNILVIHVWDIKKHTPELCLQQKIHNTSAQVGLFRLLVLSEQQAKAQRYSVYYHRKQGKADHYI